MVDARDQIATMLRGLGSDEDRIAAITEPINETVKHDLKRKIANAIDDEINARRRSGVQVDAESVREQTQPLIDEYDRGNLIGVLRRLHFDTPAVEQRMDEYERFVRERRRL
jgi:hypothetical protein